MKKKLEFCSILSKELLENLSSFKKKLSPVKTNRFYALIKANKLKVGIFAAVLLVGLISVPLLDKLAKEKKILAEQTAFKNDLTGQGGFDSVVSFPIVEDKIQSELFYSVYRVKKGDMISTIAEQFDVTQDCIISINSIKNSRTIQIGQYLRIPSISGILYTTKSSSETPQSIAEKYSIPAEQIAYVNKIDATSSLSMDSTLFLPGAELDWVTRQEINGDLFMRPLRSSYYITSNFGWRRNPFTDNRTYHNGTDMASAYGTSVYAALSGKVIAAGWDNTYGNYVIIAHHSGYRTLYGHMSKITTSYGRSIGTGTKIGEVGSTGLSTGPHLHFTVFKHGKALNPRSLWN